MYSVDRIYAWAFDGAFDPEVKYYMLSMYCEQLERFDPIGADELRIWLTLNQPSKSTLGEQLQIPLEHEQKKARI